MIARYVWRELVRNPRRTFASLAGVTLGIGLFSGVLFFIDGSGASMTQRAIAPLAIDMQRVLTTPLGGELLLTERLSASGPLSAGQTTRVTLTVRNTGVVPANEVVVSGEPPAPLTYVAGSTTLDGRPLDDKGGIPLAQGQARIGLNIGTVGPGRSVRLMYVARAARAVAATGALRLRGTISSRENVLPTPANVSPPVTLDELAAKVGSLPGVAAADRLAFVDLPSGSLSAGGATVKETIRVFGFDRTYQQHYPSIRVVTGSFRGGAAVLSAEASRALAAGPGAMIELSVPGRSRPLTVRASGVANLARANPLFYSRRSGKLEDFLYVPNAIVLDPATFAHVIIPAFRAASAARGSIVKNLPLEELDVLVERSRLQSDPGTALAQTRAIAGGVRRIAPRQDYLIDNISNTLEVARDDASVAKRMFVFLGLPGALLAAFLAAYAGSILASAQRREQANLRLRGADRGHLLRMLVYRTLALAGVGSVIGTCLGFLSVLVILGRSTFFEAAATELLISGLIAVAVGVVLTALALYIPGHRSLRREIGQERSELALGPAPVWRRLRLDFVLLGAVAVGETVAFQAGAFDAPPGSVYTGRAVSLPSHLLLAPVAVWIAGTLVSVRFFQTVASRVPLPAPPRFGPPIRGTLARTLRRRSWALGGGVAAVGLVVAFGTSLAFFTATFDTAKAADSRFVVGSDLRVTPSVLSNRTHPPGFASKLLVPGVTATTPVVFKLENAVVTSAYDEARADLAAIDPASFERVAPLADSFFVGASAAGTMSALRAEPRGVLIEVTTADNLRIEKGDRVQVLLARGTKRQALVTLRVVGLFERFPGFAQGASLVANLGYYRAATGLRNVDFFLVATVDHGHAGLARAADALRAGPGRHDPITIDSTEDALDKDQSSLTALNVHGLLDLDSFFTLLMTGAGIAIFVFGMMLQRRREYVTLRAQGMRTREIRTLVLGEAAIVGLCGLAAGIVVGTGMAFLLVEVLRPLFILHPSVTVYTGDIVTLAGLAIAATLASAFVATDLLRRLDPTELLREE